MIELFIRMHTWCLVVLAQPGDTRAADRHDRLNRVGQLDPPHVLRTLNGPAHLDPLFPADTTAIAATSHRRQMADSGQATTEYALVMLGAAAVALLVITWATAGGGAGRIGRLFDHVIDSVVSRI